MATDFVKFSNDASDRLKEEVRLAWLAGANWAHPGIVVEAGDNPYEATA